VNALFWRALFACFVRPGIVAFSFRGCFSIAAAKRSFQLSSLV